MGREESGLTVGRFCQTSSNILGIGRLTGVDGDTASIRYTDLPFGEYQHTYEVPVDTVRVGDLPVETRAFVPMNGYWTAGRVQGRYRDQYRILLPNGLVADLDETEFEVRWSRPLEDPAAALAECVTGSPVFHTARLPFRINLQKQRSIVHGYTAISSAAIALYPHQINTAARVLVDPVMRYLLADEVGLGKTIQAGIVIRQLLLDDRDAHVVVAVPATLIKQWTDELSEKFLINSIRPLGRSRVTVAPFDRLSEAVALNEPDLLVVDEVHTLCDGSPTEYESLREATSTVKGLLLLTATPYRGRPETFLRMLHLLDPLAYPLDDVVAFERRIVERQEDAYAVISLDADLPGAVLRPLVEDIEKRHSYDPKVVELAKQATAAIDGDSRIDEAIGGLRTHLTEANRISRRVIRTSRGSLAADGFPVRGRSLEIVTVERPTGRLIDSFLERAVDVWPSDSDGLSFDALVEDCLTGPPSLAATLNGLEATTSDSLLHGLIVDLRAELSLLDEADFDWVVGPTRDAIRSLGPKGVVACTSAPKAEAISRALRVEFGSRAVAEHRQDMPIEDRDSAVQAFTRLDDCRLLVIDASGEEGRNLQNASFIIHTDLPVSPNRLEQRIGRVDRFGSGRPVLNVLLLDDRSAYERQLAMLMIDGVGVFDKSVATLQLSLAKLEGEIRADLNSTGLAALERDLVQLQAELEDQREQIDELEEIESSEREVEFSADSVHNLLEYEDAWGEVEAAFDAFTASGDGGVQIWKAKDDENPNIFEYTVDPGLKTIPLMRVDRLNAFAKLLPGRRSFSRMVALRNPGVRPVRLGDPMVDWLEEYLDLDDRGKAWGIWRQVSGLAEGETLAFFRFDFALAFREDHLAGLLPDKPTVRRVRRRGDAFFPRRSTTVWMHVNRQVPADVVARVLERPESQRAVKGKDFNLSWKYWDTVRERFPAWFDDVVRARSTAVELVGSRKEVIEEADIAMERARRELDRQLATLKAASIRPDRTRVRTHLRDELELHEKVREAILSGLAEPSIDLFSAGCVIVSSDPPEAPQ